MFPWNSLIILSTITVGTCFPYRWSRYSTYSRWGKQIYRFSHDFCVKCVEKSISNETLKNDDLAAFGLGHGVDASNPYPLNSQHRIIIVRKVLPDHSNVQERIKDVGHIYEEVITSLSSHKSSVVSSVSDLVGKVVTFSAEAEYVRKSSKEMKAKGMKAI